MDNDKLVVVRGGGDIATGVIYALWNAGYKIIVLETAFPSAIRRYVSLCEAVYDGFSKVEDMQCQLCNSLSEAKNILNSEIIPMLIDPECTILKEVQPYVVVDAILAKRNIGTHINMAPITIALGPGFCAGTDVHAVIETMRGHSLGRIIEKGYALPNTGVPGKVGGEAEKRVIHASVKGKIRNINKISDSVKCGETIAEIIQDDGNIVAVPATIDGLLRGLIRDGYYVTEGFKIADIDPRLDEFDNCFTISDKARCLGGAVLQAIGRIEKNNRAF